MSGAGGNDSGMGSFGPPSPANIVKPTDIEYADRVWGKSKWVVHYNCPAVPENQPYAMHHSLFHALEGAAATQAAQLGTVSSELSGGLESSDAGVEQDGEPHRLSPAHPFAWYLIAPSDNWVAICMKCGEMLFSPERDKVMEMGKAHDARSH